MFQNPKIVKLTIRNQRILKNYNFIKGILMKQIKLSRSSLVSGKPIPPKTPLKKLLKNSPKLHSDHRKLRKVLNGQDSRVKLQQ